LLGWIQCEYIFFGFEFFGIQPFLITQRFPFLCSLGGVRSGFIFLQQKRVINKKENQANKPKTPWSTKDTMEQIYTMKLWGGGTADFYSGEGSHDTHLVVPYVDVVISFLASFENPVVVCDLGCGDFNVGKELVMHTQKYIAVDIVLDLIRRNTDKFEQDNLEFQCLDIAVDELPSGDCAILRQVLQHLSNAEVKSIVEKLEHFKYVIVTEHLPNGEFEANKDIISGQGIRLKKQSGIDLIAPPFNLKVFREEELLSIREQNGKGVLITKLYTLF
jgi:hypothetical protein